MDNKQDNYELKVDSKYGKYMKLLIAALTALGLIGTGAHQAGFFDIESEPTSVVCLSLVLAISKNLATYGAKSDCNCFKSF
jgi:hypothetical protein